MATIHARLARQAAAEGRLAAALQVISKELGITFGGLDIPKGADEPMRRVLMAEYHADQMEIIAKKMKGK